MCSNAADKYHRATDALTKAQTKPDWQALLALLNRFELDHLRKISRDVYPLFPAPVQAYAKEMSRVEGEALPSLLHLLYLPMREMRPRDALDKGRLRLAFVARTREVKLKLSNNGSWFVNWLSKYDELIREGTRATSRPRTPETSSSSPCGRSSRDS